jgi:glycosyltransferase involved in cell wall biosynthesis
MSRESGAPRVSVVLATFNRPARLARLMGQLGDQDLPPGGFEIIVVDDGSEPPAAEALAGLDVAGRLVVLRQSHRGAAAARHRGALEARGELLVFTDDDMQIGPGFLSAHAGMHPPGSRRVVAGRIRPSSRLHERPLFERFHASVHDRGGDRPLHGDAVCTGNTSLRRADYLEVGGFDVTLEQLEDVDLGLRLEQAGAQVVFSETAGTTHDSDQDDFASWRSKARRYGRHGVRLARKHPGLVRADSWRFFFGNALAKRPVVATAVVAPGLGRWIADLVQHSARAAERLGLERVALNAASVLWDVELFRGVRAELGGLGATARSCGDFLEKAEATEGPVPGVGRISFALGRVLRTLSSGA